VAWHCTLMVPERKCLLTRTARNEIYRGGGASVHLLDKGMAVNVSASDARLFTCWPGFFYGRAAACKTFELSPLQQAPQNSPCRRVKSIDIAVCQDSR
jgi:hypothetical protein